MEMNYVHLPMKRAIHAIDPIQQLKLLRFQLAEWNVGLESTIDFHRRMLSIFGSTRDLHTLYLLPEPYKDCTAYLPFLIEQCFERGAERFIVTRTATSGDAATAPDDGDGARFEPGVEVLGWNGVPIARAIEINGESQAGSNPDARFARGLDNLTIRPLNSSLPPDEHWVDILYRAKNGVVASHREYWLVHKTSDADESSTPHSRKRTALDLKRTRILEVKKDAVPARRHRHARVDQGRLVRIEEDGERPDVGLYPALQLRRGRYEAIPQVVHQPDHEGRLSAGRSHPGRSRQSGWKHPRRGIAAATVYAATNRAGVVRVHQHAAELSDLQVCAG